MLNLLSNRKSLEKETEEGLETVLWRNETAEISRARVLASRRFFMMRYSDFINSKYGIFGY